MDARTTSCHGTSTAVGAMPGSSIRSSRWSPDAGKIKMELKPVEPGIQNIMQGIMFGQVPDAKKALAELDGKLQAALEEAFTAAKAGGADVDFQQTVFANWDPSREYTQADYDALS